MVSVYALYTGLSMKRFNAIIFDMDGVIVDSEPRHERAFREVFQEMGHGETHGIDFSAILWTFRSRAVARFYREA